MLLTLNPSPPDVLEPVATGDSVPMTADAAFKSTFLRTLRDRGFIHQITHPEELDEACATGTIAAYIGFDATAPSLHVGSLIQIMMLRRLQQAGHKPIVLMGGGTTKVGDPTGKDESRKLLSEADIQANIDSIKTVFARFLTFGDGPTDAVMVDNDEWLSKFGYVQFLRDYGVHFTVNRMLAFDSVKQRLEREQPMTFLEFNYMLMQSVDFLELSRSRNCLLQMGGSDQWGNILNGVELIRRVDHKPAFGLTTPLLSTASGAKMGKTAQGAVWLNADMRSPYDYWQFWRNAEDADVGRFLKLFTDMPLDEVARYEAMQGAAINEAKKALADAATTMLHGAEAAKIARQTAEETLEQGGASSDLDTVEADWETLEWHHDKNWKKRSAAALVKAANLAKSMNEAKSLVKGGGVKINDQVAKLEDWFGRDELYPGVDAIKVAVGKKKIVLVRPV